MNLAQALDNRTTTENGAESFKSTGSALLDLFAHAGALRTGGGDVSRIVDMFEKAFSENSIYAIATAFYMRDVRHGQGERLAFRYILDWLATEQPSRFLEIAALIPEYGRWDDLLIFAAHAKVGDIVRDMVNKQLRRDSLDDSNGKSVSLLAKWMPSEFASNEASRKFARYWMQVLGYCGRTRSNPGGYRRLLTRLRRRIGIPETLMSQGRWGEIDYSKVPSRTMYINRKAFMRHDGERFKAYLQKVNDGKSKINAGALYPYEIVGKLLRSSEDDALQAMWDALPDYFNGSAQNVMCVCDTSGSMSYGDGTPLLVALSLTMYAAERMNGFFADTAITFSATPQFVTISRAESISQRYRHLTRGSGYNTNFQAVLDLLLSTAVRYGIPADQMPSVIFVISDMQFDQADGSVTDPYGGNKQLLSPTNFELVREKYKNAGYAMPRFVMWNVRAAHDQPVLEKEPGVFLVSGCSPVIFKNALALDTSIVTPHDAMMHVLNSERLQPVLNALR